MKKQDIAKKMGGMKVTQTSHAKSKKGGGEGFPMANKGSFSKNYKQANA